MARTASVLPLDESPHKRGRSICVELWGLSMIPAGVAITGASDSDAGVERRPDAYLNRLLNLAVGAGYGLLLQQIWQHWKRAAGNLC